MHGRRDVKKASRKDVNDFMNYSEAANPDETKHADCTIPDFPDIIKC